MKSLPPKKFKINKQEVVYQGFFRLKKYQLQHTLFNGGWSQQVMRELFMRGNCVAVILYDPIRDEVVLIEQFRMGAILDSEGAWLTEIVAGAIEADESAENVAYRESIEEAGCKIEKLLLINEFYTTPGGSSEKISLFCGKIDASQVGGVHGLTSEDEDILTSVATLDTAYQLVESGKIKSSISIIAIQWLYINKQKIIQQWA